MTTVPGEIAVNVRLLRIGTDVLPVYGDDETGWGVYQGDLYPAAPAQYRYRSLDELFFVLVNLNITTCGRA